MRGARGDSLTDDRALWFEVIQSAPSRESRPGSRNENLKSAAGALLAAIALIVAIALVNVSSDGGRRYASLPEDSRESGDGPDLVADRRGSPTMSVDEDDELVDGQSLTVSGAGFRPETSVMLTQCVLGLVEPVSNCYRPATRDQVHADADGRFTTMITARRHLATYTGPVDCADLWAGRCALVVTGYEAADIGSSRFAGARQLRYSDVPADVLADRPYESGPDARSEGGPEHSVVSSLEPSADPSRDLHDGELVEVRLEGGDAYAPVRVELCARGTPPDGTCPPVGEYEFDRTGAALLELRLPRLTRHWSDGTLVDCADGCDLRVTSAEAIGDTAITFEPSADLLGPATLTVEEIPLVPGRPVVVSGSGLVPSTSVDAFICSKALDRDDGFWLDPVNWCGLPTDRLWSGEPTLSPDGTFKATLIPPSTIDLLGWDGPHNCLMQDCWLVVMTGHVPGMTPIASQLLVYDEIDRT